MTHPSMKYLLAIRNDTDIKIDLLKTRDGWYQIRWLRAEDDGVTVYQKLLGLSREEILRIAEVVQGDR